MNRCTLILTRATRVAVAVDNDRWMECRWQHETGVTGPCRGKLEQTLAGTQLIPIPLQPLASTSLTSCHPVPHFHFARVAFLQSMSSCMAAVLHCTCTASRHLHGPWAMAILVPEKNRNQGSHFHAIFVILMIILFRQYS